MNHLKSKLLQRVAIEAGFSIVTKNDCRLLAELIKNKTGEHLSESTLYRLFLEKDPNHRFYKTTYDILSRFIELENWNSFCESAIHSESVTGISLFSPNYKEETTLLDIVIQKEMWDIAKDYFDAISMHAYPERHHHLGWSIYLALLKNPEKEIRFYELFSGHPIVRVAFFELGADPDFHLSAYEVGLTHYLGNVNPTHSLEDLRAFTFAKCMIIRRKYIEGKIYACQQLFTSSFNENLEKNILENIRPIYPVARYFQAKIMCTLISGSDGTHLYREFLFWAERIWSDLTLTERKAIIYCYAESVALTKSSASYIIMLRNSFKPFFLMLFGNRKSISVSLILERTEFNGIRLQRNFQLYI